MEMAQEESRRWHDQARPTGLATLQVPDNLLV